MKKLPIGISTFGEIITEDYAYVDKTRIALDLIKSGKYYFLSRPRRFGKSLFLDTLKGIFSGYQDLFKGLYIYDKYDFKKYPVIHISFGGGSFKTVEDYKTRIFEILRKNQSILDITCKNKTIAGYFEELIKNLKPPLLF